MARELTPGVIAKLFDQLAMQAAARGRTAVEALAIIIETQAKMNASTGSHRYGTPTPARPGSGPAIVSGALRRSITHTPAVLAGGTWTSTVGLAAGVFHPHPPHSRGGKRHSTRGPTPVSKVGYYLETGLRNGTTYPFLVPAFRFGVTVAAPNIYRSIFGAAWTT